MTGLRARNVIRDLTGAGGWGTEVPILVDPGEPMSALCAVLDVSSAGDLDAWRSLVSTGRVSGVATCAVLPPAKPGDAASAISANRIAAETGDGRAYRVIENETIIGLPGANQAIGLLCIAGNLPAVAGGGVPLLQPFFRMGCS